MNRGSRVLRWLMIVAASGILPAFVLRCDKAALNFQRGLLQGLGEDVGDLIIEQVAARTDVDDI